MRPDQLFRGTWVACRQRRRLASVDLSSTLSVGEVLVKRRTVHRCSVGLNVGQSRSFGPVGQEDLAEPACGFGCRFSCAHLPFQKGHLLRHPYRPSSEPEWHESLLLGCCSSPRLGSARSAGQAGYLGAGGGRGTRPPCGGLQIRRPRASSCGNSFWPESFSQGRATYVTTSA